MRQLESQKRRRIFVAEDDRGVLDLIITRLALAGYDTAYGRDGYEALDGIYATRPDAIILDINMPRLDGFGVLEQLRKMKAGRGAPVMVLTARHSPDDVRRALSLGARDFLAKPFQDSQLLARVPRLLQGKPPSSRPASVLI